AELLRIPQFLKRYDGRYHSVVANYELTNGNFTRDPRSIAVQRAERRISLVLALIRRASPQTTTWLAVGYNGSPSWRQWVRRQEKSNFDGVALTGRSANLACMQPSAVKFIASEFSEEIGQKRIGLVGFADPFLNPKLQQDDDFAVGGYASLRTAHRASGLAFTHIQEKR
ncbi:MAG: hypothetical protein ACYTF6_09865, partial [Planctomycetota bacterium]